jgi:hypothetical protein
MSTYKKLREREIFEEGVVLDSPALAAVKRFFNQLQREQKQIPVQ